MGKDKVAERDQRPKYAPKFLSVTGLYLNLDLLSLPFHPRSWPDKPNAPLVLHMPHQLQRYGVVCIVG